MDLTSDFDLDLNLDFGYARRRKTTTPPELPLDTAPSGFMADKHPLRRTHSQMESGEPSEPTWRRLHQPFAGFTVPNDAAHNASRPSVSGLHLPLPRMPNMTPPPPFRFAGDGLDYRRPISLTRAAPSPPVIDLTDDSAPSASSSRPPSAARVQRPPQRGPRYNRNIIDEADVIDLEALPEAPSRRSVPSSPEVQFIESRRITPEARVDQPGRHPGGEDDLEITGSNTIRRQRTSFGDMLAITQALSVDGYGHPFGHLVRHVQQRQQRQTPPRYRGARPAREGPFRPAAAFVPPVNMNYDEAAFDPFTGERPAAPPTYEAPPPAPPGFTRSPEESGALACPNCDAELCVGETELQRQVWVVKGCGHVYCGQCTAHRHRKRSTKGKEKALPAPADHKPFKECVVEGCDKKTSSPKSMIQVFL